MRDIEQLDDRSKLEIIETIVFDDDEPDRSFDHLQIQVKKLLLCAKFLYDVETSLEATCKMMDMMSAARLKEGVC